MRVHTFRLEPGQDLRREIQKFVDKKKIQAGFIITCVAGLEKAVLRMADATPDKQVVKTYEEKLEVVSLVGTVSINGSHLHIAVSNKDGKVIGGHLKEGSLVAFTAEVIIGEDLDHIFLRKPDEMTGFDELVIQSVHNA